MDAEDLVRRRFAESIDVKRALADDEHVASTARAAELIAAALRAGGKVLLCGNGGSAADATHLAAELVGRFYVDRGPLPALSLSENASVVTCIANDYEFDEIYARQVRAHGRPGDVLVALSTSGGSPNVIAAVRAARELDMAVIGFTGRDECELAGGADVCLQAPSTDTPRVQECHMLVGHTICELVELSLFGPTARASAPASRPAGP
jgi:D-sedoheptulose 7-phosphate isomerase